MNKKLSIKEVLKANEDYNIKGRELEKLYNKTKDINSQIDLEEVKETLNYKEVKELCKTLFYRISNKEIEKELLNIKNNKKIQEYPQILDVHYYPEINNIDFLNKEEKINLDRLIKEIKERPRKIYELHECKSSDKVIEFLCSNGILEKRYSFSCKCGSDECYKEYITEKEKELFYVHHSFDYETATDEELKEHDEKFHDGYFEVGCWNDGGYEVCSIEDFEENVDEYIDYRIVKKPDMTLDNI